MPVCRSQMHYNQIKCIHVASLSRYVGGQLKNKVKSPALLGTEGKDILKRKKGKI